VRIIGFLLTAASLGKHFVSASRDRGATVKDDIVIGVTANGSGSRVDARSLSRIGGSDFGTNAKRIRTFLRQLDAAKEGS
jgi:uncharacterized protein (DUF1499 family)